MDAVKEWERRHGEAGEEEEEAEEKEEWLEDRGEPEDAT